MSISAHGGELINRYVPETEQEAMNRKAAGLKTWKPTSRELSDLEMIASGALSPLTGFMCKEDTQAVINTMHLKNGIPWTIPVTLAVSEEFSKSIKEGEEITLQDESDESIAIVEVDEVYGYDVKEMAQKVFQTTEEAHPGVAALYQMGPRLIGGTVHMLRKRHYTDFLKYRLEPAETRALFQEKEWRTVVGFQTRNPIHRAHEYLQKCALEIVDGLLIHPIVGDTKDDDIPADVSMACYEMLLSKYYPENRTALVVNPAAMRYGGPREAIFHAIIRKNYGCTHFIVGRDHAGVGNYYGTYDAQEIFQEFDRDALGITPLMFEHAFFCQKCGNMASSKTCPHGKESHVFLSGTKVREMLQRGEMPPEAFTRPEVAQILMDAARAS